MEDVVNYGTVIIAAISALAFVVSVITQVTKSIAFFSKIPTQLIAASIIAAFFVAFGYNIFGALL